MFQMLQQLQFTVCSLGQDWRAEGLHNLLHSDALVGEVVFGGAVHKYKHQSAPCISHGRGERLIIIPDQAKSAHPNRLEIRVSAQKELAIAVAKRGHSKRRFNSLVEGYPAYLDVISKVVPKIWARTNSAMMFRGVTRGRIAGWRWFCLVVVVVPVHAVCVGGGGGGADVSKGTKEDCSLSQVQSRMRLLSRLLEGPRCR